MIEILVRSRALVLSVASPAPSQTSTASAAFTAFTVLTGLASPVPMRMSVAVPMALTLSMTVSTAVAVPSPSFPAAFGPPRRIAACLTFRASRPPPATAACRMAFLTRALPVRSGSVRFCLGRLFAMMRCGSGRVRRRDGFAQLRQNLLQHTLVKERRFPLLPRLARDPLLRSAKC